MPILDLPRRPRTAGQLRSGVVAHGRRQDGSTYSRPASLETWRATSADRELVAAIAELYGGVLEPWQPHGGKAEAWAVTTETDRIPVIVPPVGALEAWHELWAAGGLERRCDGRVIQGTLHECACPTDPERRRELAAKGRACRPTTRLAVLLADLPAVGTWRVTSRSVYAAIELPGTVELLSRASAAGEPIVASLRLERREKRVAGQPTSAYYVPTIVVPPAPTPAMREAGYSRETFRALPAGEVLVDVGAAVEPPAAAVVDPDLPSAAEAARWRSLATAGRS
ncbi:MAG: hypothetical protein L0227_09835 [Chloroflexi bacterium]|nr:hypothetical protein [Chloroflexota bacterium]